MKEPLALLLGLHPLAVRLLLPLVRALLNLLEVRLDGKSRLGLLCNIILLSVSQKGTNDCVISI